MTPRKASTPPATMPVPVSRGELDQIVRGEHGHPHAVLGPHEHDGHVTVRVLKPLASSVLITYPGGETALEHEHGGIWAGVLDGVTDTPSYRARRDLRR